MLKDHIEVLLDEQETFNRSHQAEGKLNYFVSSLFLAMLAEPVIHHCTDRDKMMTHLES